MRRELDKATVSLKETEEELGSVQAALASAREGQETQRLRSKRESKRAMALEKELVASEARQKLQEEEISVVRHQVWFCTRAINFREMSFFFFFVIGACGVMFQPLLEVMVRR